MLEIEEIPGHSKAMEEAQEPEITFHALTSWTGLRTMRVQALLEA